ncbi:hypothetical protein CC86DRAFT_403712 [Ophiobolus disseminans]|uniref:Uncharacterized protein n=1 Tax=Ophiobolus disseminans TaxID=1469910 RepID=A0A6A7A6Z2_9PLEO|nr:hypothetical protein CC86DRAFT_403712 [Ophiobolus disseminans]
MWAYAYEHSIGLDINRTTHFATYLKHSPQLWAQVGDVPMMKVGGLKYSRQDVFAMLSGMDGVTLATEDGMTLRDADVPHVEWLELFSWMYSAAQYDTLRGLMLFHLYSHHHSSYGDGVALDIKKGLLVACGMVKLRQKCREMHADAGGPSGAEHGPNMPGGPAGIPYFEPMLDAVRHRYMYSMRHGLRGGFQILNIGYLDSFKDSFLDLWLSNTDENMIFVLGYGGVKPIYAFVITDEEKL